MNLFEQAAIKKRVFTLWDQVFSASNKILVDAKIYGFSHMDVVPDPNIHQMRLTLSVVESLLDTIIDHHFDKLEHDQARMVINAREQLRRMEKIAIALQTNDQLEYDNSIAELEKQLAI